MCFQIIALVAIEYHKRNLVHGDIKPKNIFYAESKLYYNISSDIGSILYLGEKNEKEGKYLINTAT